MASSEHEDVVAISLAGINGDEFGITLDDAKKVRAMRAFMNSRDPKAAVMAAGVAVGTWYAWLRNDPAFRAIYQNILEVWASDVEVRLFDKALEGEIAAILPLLKAWNKARYGDKQTIEIVSPIVGQCLADTATAISEVVHEALPDGGLADVIIGRLKSRLREIWNKDAA